MSAKTEITLSDDVIEALRDATVAGMHLQLGGQLDRKLYQRVAKVIEALGGKWNRKAQAHVFDYDARDAVDDAIAAGAVVDMRKLYQFYPTPSEIAAKLVQLADVKPGMRVLEPSAGTGAIIQALCDAGVEVDQINYCEIQKKNREHLIKCFGVELSCVAADFLTCTDVAPYDRIVANPPFAQRQDITHVAHMYELLAPGGKLVSVLSPRWTFGEDRLSRGFRQAVQHLHAAHLRANGVDRGGWELLPEGSFKPSGTAVNAGILQLTKLAANPLLAIV